METIKKTIGIIGCKEKKLASYVLGEVLKDSGYLVCIVTDYDMNLEGFETLRKNNDIVILEIDLEKIEEISLNNIKLDIVIDIDMTLDECKQKNYLLNKIELIKKLTKYDLFIVNTDNRNSIRLSAENRNSLVLGYGLSRKSSITASSIDFDDNKIKFNLCLQRKLTTIFNRDIEQFEYPIEINIEGMENLLSIIAVISASLYLNINLEVVAKILFKLKVN